MALMVSHAAERHPFCDCRIVCQFAVLVTVRQPIFNRPSTATKPNA